MTPDVIEKNDGVMTIQPLSLMTLPLGRQIVFRCRVALARPRSIQRTRPLKVFNSMYFHTNQYNKTSVMIFVLYFSRQKRKLRLKYNSSKVCYFCFLAIFRKIQCLAFEVFFIYPSRLLFQFYCCLSLPNHGGHTTAQRRYMRCSSCYGALVQVVLVLGLDLSHLCIK